jgi:hypothetical protein
LEAEVMADADSGRLDLVASTSPQFTDFGVVSPARLRDLVAAAREQLVEFERLADEQEARDTLHALLVEHRFELEEWDTASLDPKLRGRFTALAWVQAGHRLIVVPAGQDPVERLAAVRELIEDMRGAA